MKLNKLALALILVCGVSHQAQAESANGLAKYDFNIQAQSANAALLALAVQRDLNIAFLADATKDLQTNELIGEFTLAQALEKMLAGTRLRATIVNDRVIQIELQRRTPRPFNHKSYYEPIAAPTDVVAAVQADKTEDRVEQEPIETILVVGKLTSPYNMGTTVSSTKTQKDFLSTAQTVHALPEAFSKDTSARSYADAISYLSSVGYLERGAGITDELRMRGFAYPSLKINGVGAHAYVAPVDLVFVDNIEVAKGPSSVLFGRMEPGGLVNMMLKRPDGSSRYVSAATGTDDFARFEFDGQLSLTDNTGLRLISFSQEQGSETSVDLNDSQGFMLASATDLADSGQINLHYRFESETILQQFGRPIEGFNDQVFFFRDDDGSIELVAPREEDVRSGIDADRSALYLGFNDFLLGNWSLDMHLQYDKYKATSQVSYPVIEDYILDFNGDTITNVELNRILRNNPELFDQLIERLQTISIDPDSISYDEENFAYDTQFFSAEWTAYQNMNIGNWQLEQLYGVNYNDSEPQALIWQNHDSRSNFVPAGQTEILSEFDPEQTKVTDRNLGVFAQWVASWRRFTWFLGTRIDRLSLTVKGENLDLKEDFSEFTYRLGGVYKATPTTSVFGNFSVSFSPQFRLLEREFINGEGEFDSIRRVTIPSPAQSRQYELGLKQTWLNEQVQTTCTYYDIEKSDIASLVQAQTSRGIECDAAGSLSDTWHLLASFSKTKAEVTASEDEEFIGLQPRMTPQLSAALWLNKDIELSQQWSSRWALGWKFVDERFINLDNEVKLDQYQTFELALSLNYNTALDLHFAVKNAFDQEYTQGVFNALPYWTNPGRGRTVETRLSYRF